MEASAALQQFMDMWAAVATAFVPFVVPLLAITWAIRLTAQLLRGR